MERIVELKGSGFSKGRLLFDRETNGSCWLVCRSSVNRDGGGYGWVMEGWDEDVLERVGVTGLPLRHGQNSIRLFDYLIPEPVTTVGKNSWESYCFIRGDLRAEPPRFHAFLEQLQDLPPQPIPKQRG